MDGTVSQIFDIGFSFCFLKCGIFCLKKSIKSARFLA